MKKLILVALVTAAMFTLSGCGSDNGAGAVDKASITFAVMSSAGNLSSTATGYQYVMVAGTVPAFNNISTTTEPAPTSGQTPGYFTFFAPAGAQRISASALIKAGPFANNSSVSNRTKLCGYIITDPVQNIKNIKIFLLYSTPRTPGAVIVSGSSVNFATLKTSFPIGAAMSAEIINDMNRAFWSFQTNGPPWGNYCITNATIWGSSGLVNAVPTISSVVLGF